MGEAKNSTLRLSFDRCLRLEFHGAKVTVYAGLLAYRGPDEALGLTTLREKLIKIGAKVVTHARYTTFQMAEVAVSRQLFRAIIERIRRLWLPPPVPDTG